MRDVTPFEKDAQAQNATLFWRCVPSSENIWKFTVMGTCTTFSATAKLAQTNQCGSRHSDPKVEKGVVHRLLILCTLR